MFIVPTNIGCIKRLFRCAANAIFSEIGRHASEKVTLQPVLSKYMTVLFNGLEAWF